MNEGYYWLAFGLISFIAARVLPGKMDRQLFYLVTAVSYALVIAHTIFGGTK